MYSGTLPDIVIPLPLGDHGPVIPNRFHLTIVPTGQTWPAERREISLASVAESSNLEDPCLTLSLTDPRFLGPTPGGRFTIQVRGRLGQDVNFPICILPEIKFHFSPEVLLPDPNTGSQDVLFALESPHVREITVQSPAELVPQDSTFHEEAGWFQVRVPAESEQVALLLRFFVGREMLEVPLEIAVPRFRWTVSGLSDTGALHWHDRLFKVSLQELEEAQESRLLVQGDFGQAVTCTLVLQGTNHQHCFELVTGKTGCPLSPFLDSLREGVFPRNYFDLEISLPRGKSSTRIRLLQVETTWIVENLQIVQDLAEDKRVVLLSWLEKRGIKNRMLRLWNLGYQQEEPIEVLVEDGNSEVEIERTVTDFPQGQYRLEFAILDRWALSPPLVPPGPYGDNVRDLYVREDGITILDSFVCYTDLVLDSITTGAAIADLALDPQVLQVFASGPEQAGRFCRALYVRE